jgi:hypothetical protein
LPTPDSPPTISQSSSLHQGEKVDRLQHGLDAEEADHGRPAIENIGDDSAGL